MKKWFSNSSETQDQSSGLGIGEVVRRVFSLPTLLSIAFGLAVIGFLLWRVLDFEWNEFTAHLIGINWWLFALGVLLYYVSFWFRGWRWRIIYSAAERSAENGARKDSSSAPSTLTMSGLILSGWFINSVMFFRIGDAYRGWALSDRTSSQTSTALGTVFAERVQDMAVVLILVVVSAIWVLLVDGFAASGRIVDAAVIVVAIAAVLVLVLFIVLAAMNAADERLTRLVPERFRDQYRNFRDGTLNSFRGGRIPTQITLGILGWLMEVARFYFVAQAMGLDMAMSIAMFAALANAIMTTIPVPGGLGFVETALVTLLLLTGLNHTDAFTLALLDRSISWLSVVAVGGLVFLVMTVRRNAARNRAAAATTDVSDEVKRAD